jgi:outer membrane protein TolC
MRPCRSTALLLLLAALGCACAIHPRGERAERERAREAGRDFEDEAEPPPLPAEPRPEDYLRRAFFASASLRQRYWEWRAALERIPQAASPPNVALTFGTLFGDEDLEAWERTTLALSTDPMTNLPLPSKLARAGRRALEEARAAGLRFEAEKFRLQAEVLSGYLDLALHGEEIRIQEERVALLGLAAGDARAGLAAGRQPVGALQRARTELELARNELESLHAQLPSLVARMNTLLGRDPRAAVPLPRAPLEPRPFTVSDADILALAAERSPELAALAREVAGKEEALALAQQSWLPDLNPILSVTGSVSQTLGAMIVLPTRVEAIRAGVAEAQALLNAAHAAHAQYSRDLAASFVLNLLVLHGAERQARLFAETIEPRAELLARSAAAGYASGAGSLEDLVAARLAVLDARLARERLRAEREKALVAIETWSALDVEALHAVGLRMPGM